MSTRLDKLMDKNAGEGAALLTNKSSRTKDYPASASIRKIPAAFFDAIEEVRAEAAEKGQVLSLNQFLLDAVREKLERHGKLK